MFGDGVEGRPQIWRLKPCWSGEKLKVEQRWRLQPRLESTVRLRYASVLYEETDNHTEAETVLTAGVGVDLSSIDMSVLTPI